MRHILVALVFFLSNTTIAQAGGGGDGVVVLLLVVLGVIAVIVILAATQKNPKPAAPPVEIKTVSLPEGQHMEITIRQNRFPSEAAYVYGVSWEIAFSEEAKAIIDKYALRDQVVDEKWHKAKPGEEAQQVDIPYRDRNNEFMIKHHYEEMQKIYNKNFEDFYGKPHPVSLAQFLEEGSRYFDSLAEAEQYEQKLRTKILPHIKDLITHHGTPPVPADTFTM